MAKLTPEELLLRKLDQRVKKAMEDYRLIEDGDKILIGLSGGKDSLALVDLLGRRMRIFKPEFSVVAAHIVMTNIPYQSNIEYLKNHAEQYGIPFVQYETSFDEATDHRKSPCFLCSWNRRKALFSIAKEQGCNKIALGHHQDDILETLLMNQIFQGAFSTMSPKLKMDKFDMTIIRPLALTPESELIQLAENQDYRKLAKNCPYEKTSHRSEIKAILKQMEQLNPQARHSLWSSMSNIQYDYLPKSEIKETR